MLQDSLKGLKVIELATVLAGPAVGMFFAELGAEVVKIENKRTGGDPTRGWKSALESTEDPASAYYHCVNWHKHIIFLDLGESSDRLQLSAYLQSADVLIVNFKEGDAEKFDLKSSVLLDRYPSLIIGEIHVLAAHQLKEGILLALWKRERSGKGAIVSTSLYRSALASLINQSSAYLNTNVVPSQLGSLHPNIAPYGEKVLSKDQQPILLAVGTDGQFRNLCDVLGKQSLSKESKFLTNADRVKNRIDLQSELTTLFSKQDAATVLSKLHQAKVPAAKIRKLDEVLNDSLAKEMVLEQMEPNGKISKRMATVAFKIESL